MRILVFGANGQVGSELGRLPDIERLGSDRAACDLTTPGAAAAIIEATDCDAVINAAAYTAVDKAESEPDLAEAVNARAPGEMAAAAASRGLPFVHVSTDYVFDGKATRPYLETGAPHPLNVYGATKLRGEEAVASAGGAYAILRTSWVFSAHGSNFVKTMLRLSGERDTLRVVADQSGKPTSAVAIAKAGASAARALGGDPSKAGLYHFASAKETTWADFAIAIFESAGRRVAVKRIATREYPTPAKRPLYSVLETKKFEEAFGIAAPSWRDDLDDVIRELAADREKN